MSIENAIFGKIIDFGLDAAGNLLGGGGDGAQGNALVTFATTVIGVDIIFPGQNYSTPPRVKIIDACQKGKGAKARAILED